jgi:hypothetical protein
MTATEFVQTLDALYGDEPLMDQRDPQSLEFAGWLDLPWMTVDSMVITSMNDDVLPSTATGHPFFARTPCAGVRHRRQHSDDCSRCYAMKLACPHPGVEFDASLVAR